MNLSLNKYIKGIGKLINALVIIAYLVSCSHEKKNMGTQKEYRTLIDEFNMVFPFLNLDDSWEPNIESNPSQEYFFQIEKKDSLAKFNNIWINKYKYVSEGISDSSSNVCYSISRIFYYWFDGKEGRAVEYNDRLDTLWEYKHIGEITDLHQEIFIKGKYQFMYSNHMLKPEQRKYFEIHSDSLRNIGGNDLPELPEIDG
ncbi:hypothetical protein [Negadavirga shengliensis]|uniref:Lipoprotein n=1 Tax=Negadavirga shengliensis TaxID=1389218 RepID=A0ABV9T688_9BACT